MGKKTVLILFSVSVVSHGATLVDRVAIVETNNRNVTGDRGRALGVWQIHAAAWADVSASRAKRNLSIFPYSAAMDAKIARIYASEYLLIVTQRLDKLLGRTPSYAEIYCAYNLGVEGFRRRSLLMENCPSITRSSAARVARLEQ